MCLPASPALCLGRPRSALACLRGFCSSFYPLQGTSSLSPSPWTPPLQSGLPAVRGVPTAGVMWRKARLDREGSWGPRKRGAALQTPFFTFEDSGACGRSVWARPAFLLLPPGGTRRRAFPAPGPKTRAWCCLFLRMSLAFPDCCVDS